MTRLKGNLGKIAHPSIRFFRSLSGSNGARAIPPRAPACTTTNQPSQPREHCKTCKDRGCTGHCQF